MTLLLFIISVFASYGLAVALVEKRSEFPIRPININLRFLLRKIFGRKFAKMLKCTVCTSFWAALVVDLFLLIFIDHDYFLWPISGFAALGLTWTIIEFLNAIDKDDEPTIVYEEDESGEKL